MMGNEPLVSIIMPYYRLGDYLLEAVDSIKKQTHANWELIIVDDCSPENAARDLLSDERDERIHVYRHDSNLGTAAARNTAASKSSGKYLIPLDSDDKLAPDYIEKTLRASKEADAGAAYTQVQYFGNSNRIYIPSTDLGKIFSGHFPCNTLLVKREVFDSVGGYKDLKLIEDTEFWIRIIEAGTKFTFVAEPLYLYRSHEKGLMSTQQSKVLPNFYRTLLMHHHSVAEHLQCVLEQWRDQALSYSVNAKQDSQQFLSSAEQYGKEESEYAYLKKEFDILKARHESLAQRVQRNEKMLGSLPLIARQMAFIALKKLGRK